MTEPRLTFDFNKAIEMLRDDYPEEVVKILFADLADPNIESILEKWYIKTSMEMRDNVPGITLARDLMKKNVTAAQRDLISGSQMISIKQTQEDQPRHHRILEDLQTDLLLGFTHEFGHLVTKYGIPTFMRNSDTYILPERENREINLAETSADSFSVLYLLHKKLIDQKTIYDLGLWRAIEALACGTVRHLTTIPVDQLAIEAAATDFSSLSPAVIRQIADDHANKFTRASFGLKDALDNLSSDPDNPREGYQRTLKTGFYISMVLSNAAILPEKVNELIHMLGKHCMAAPEGSMEFHLSARILMDVFETNEIRYRVSKPIDTSGAEFDGLKKQLQDRVERDPILSNLQQILRESRKPAVKKDAPIP